MSEYQRLRFDSANIIIGSLVCHGIGVTNSGSGGMVYDYKKVIDLALAHSDALLKELGIKDNNNLCLHEWNYLGNNNALLERDIYDSTKWSNCVKCGSKKL